MVNLWAQTRLLGEISDKLDIVINALNLQNIKVGDIMTEQAAEQALAQQIETDVSALGAAVSAINTALATLLAQVQAGQPVSLADITKAVSDLNAATGNVTATATTATADAGPPPSGA